ncbi:DUF4190 domain-containing protein [Streptomyces sp. NBC_01304]|uniref:DUF4190 domain-containing protein n=1 Tax=Streptomyces sp. NBC_01304 TaxID=2903818 RepID=UPI002E15856B|nr:DUF4190 domain-containing protein [Streptomyces sp. NBC_01304]
MTLPPPPNDSAPGDAVPNGAAPEQSPWATPAPHQHGGGPGPLPMAPPPPPGYGGWAPGPYAPQARNGLGIAALVCGIVGLLTGVIPFLFWLGGVLGVVALILGLIGHSNARKGVATNKGMALAGIILGALAIVAAIVWLILIVVVIKDTADEVKKESDKARGGTHSTAPSDPGDSETGPESESEFEEPEAPAPLKFGGTHTYDDGVKVTVAKPKPYTPDEFAAGHEKGNVAIQVTITIKNGSKKTLDINTALPTLRDGKGSDAEMVFDGSNGTKPFNGKLLPGKQAVSQFAFSLPANATKDLQLEVGPEVVTYEDAIWTGSAK